MVDVAIATTKKGSKSPNKMRAALLCVRLVAAFVIISAAANTIVVICGFRAASCKGGRTRLVHNGGFSKGEKENDGIDGDLKTYVYEIRNARAKRPLIEVKA